MRSNNPFLLGDFDYPGSHTSAPLACIQPMAPRVLHRYVGLIIVLVITLIGVNTWTTTHHVPTSLIDPTYQR